MARDPSFAPKLSDLSTSSLSPPNVSLYPAGGQGLGLDEFARVPVVASANRELSCVEFQADVSVTEIGIANAKTIVTAADLEFDGSRIRIDFFSPRIASGVEVFRIGVFDGTTGLGLLLSMNASERAYGTHSTYVNPTPGTHTYSIRAWNTSAATGTIGAGPGGSGATDQRPGFICVSRVAA